MIPLVALTACVAGAPERASEHSASRQSAVHQASVMGAGVDGGPTPVNVLTRSYDNQRTSANTGETLLSASNVNAAQFGKLFELPVDDQIYAQILYVSSVTIGGSDRSVIYAATVNNTVYAFDADTAGSPLWQHNFNGAGRPTRKSEVGQSCRTYNDFSGNIGIVSTPVIDASAGTMYVVTRTVEVAGTVQRLHAIDIATGAEQPGSPQDIAASVPGTGDGAVNGVIPFNPVTQNQRSSLALSNGVVYIAWASFCDTRPYHGWVVAYDGSSLAQLGVFNTTPGAGGGGIWQAGAAPAFDPAGNLYFVTGNGFGANGFDGATNFGETVLKLAPSTLNRADYFTPSNYATLDSHDTDLGSAGPTFLPASNLLVIGGKEGKSYLLDGTNMGEMAAGDAQIPQFFQSVDPTATPTATHHIHNTVALWDSPAGLNMYVSGENDYLRAYRFDPGTTRFTTPAVAVSSVLPPRGMPGGMLAVSSNGSAAGSGIVWATTPRVGDANQRVVPGMLRAYDAESLALLWESSRPADDTLSFAKFSPPTVAGGKAYVASFSNILSVYGLRPAPSPNLALGLGKVITGSAPCAATEGPEKALNGSITGGNADKWCSRAASPTLQVDLGAMYDLHTVVVRHAGAGAENLAFNTKDFNIAVSADGATFTPVASVTGNTACNTTHAFSTTTARFVRLDVVTPTQNGNTAARIYELEVYGDTPARPTNASPPSARTN